MQADLSPDRLAEAGDDLKGTPRNARLTRELGDSEGRHARLLRRLDDDRVAGRQRGPELPGEHQDREVPGQYAPDDADRLAHDHGNGIVAARRDLIVDLVSGLGVPFDAIESLRNVDRLDVVDGLATLEAFDDRELVLVAADQLGELDHRLLAPGRMQPRPGPGLEGFSRLADGQIDICLRAGRDPIEQLAGSRVDRLEGCPA